MNLPLTLPMPLPLAQGVGAAPAALALDSYTDPVAMRALLQAQLPGFADGSVRIDALRVRKARRNASLHRNPCPITLCYELRCHDRVRGHAGTQLLYAQVFRAGLAQAFYRRQDRSRLTAPAFGQALVHLDALNMVVWALPNDPGLAQLATLLDPARALAALPWSALGAALGLARADIASLHVELLRYAPQSRATLRYTLARADAAAPCVLYAKTFCNDQAADIHRRFEHFWQLAQTDADAPRVAQPLGHDAATRTQWQAPAPGLPLLQWLASHYASASASATMARVARALARLHAAALAPSTAEPPRSVAHWVAEARRRQRKIGRADPALAARAAGVVEAIVAHAAHQAARPLSLIHGDFHPDQVWVHEGRIVLFDFDEFTLGDPMEDLAEFVLKLEQVGAEPALGSTLVREYAACAPGRFDRRGLDWHLALQSLLQASRGFVYQQPGWRAEVERRLARAEACVATLALEPAA